MSFRWSGFLLLFLLFGACTSVPPVAPSRPTASPFAEPVYAADFAGSFGLRATYDRSRNRLLMQGHGHRVLLFPGTTVAVVDGKIVSGLDRLGDEGSHFRIGTDDAALLKAALEAPPEPVPAIPSVKPPVKHARRPAPHPALARAVAAGDKAWRVPLERRWRYIMIHHSGTPSGNAAVFGRFQRNKRGWDGLGYDFVIGDGHGSRDGQVEVGYRWTRQITGAHAGRAPDGSNIMNERAIGICLVGDFDKTVPTPAQRASLHRLIRFLEAYCGIPPQNVFLHRDWKDTDCPGRLFPVREFTSPKRRLPPH